MTTFKKSGGRCAVSAGVSAPSFRLHGRGRSPSGPKIQAQRAVKPKSTIQNFLTSHSPPVAVVATTPGSGFVEMILHLPIQNLIFAKEPGNYEAEIKS
jgi:hypothetical protein